MATKIFDNPANNMEKEIAEYIKPLLTAEVEEKINKDKLTLKGCVDSCLQKGKKYEVKSGNKGIAHVPDDQHWKWVREYFGIKGNVASPAAPLPAPAAQEKPNGLLDLDLDSLFD